MVIAMILMKYGHIYNLFSKVLWNKYITLAAVPEHNYNEDIMKYGLLCEDIFRNPFSVNAQLWKVSISYVEYNLVFPWKTRPLFQTLLFLSSCVYFFRLVFLLPHC